MSRKKMSRKERKEQAEKKRYLIRSVLLNVAWEAYRSDESLEDMGKALDFVVFIRSTSCPQEAHLWREEALALVDEIVTDIKKQTEVES